jgi:SAM-dependent MidA family methyltransferase
MTPSVDPAPAAPPDLARRLIDEIDHAVDTTGFVPFDRFMDLALYAEDLGYYARATTPFGPTGDFYTAPRVHPLFGRSIGRHLASLLERLGTFGRLRIVELGPGDGTLAASILPELGPEGRARGSLEYVLVERSEALARTARERIEPLGRALGVRVRTCESVGALGPFEGAVVANEFLDAQPARRLRWSGSSWSELGVRREGDRLVPAEAALSSPIPGDPLSDPLEVGAIAEISPAAEAVVREIGDHLVRGSAIFLDYGMEEPELLRAHPRGTLAAVSGHRYVDDPLAHPGATDLSTFVNFTRIRAAAQRARLEERTYLSQAEVLGLWGFQELFDAELRSAGSSENEVRLRLAAKNLLFGFERFRVLELAAPGTPRVPVTTT